MVTFSGVNFLKSSFSHLKWSTTLLGTVVFVASYALTSVVSLIFYSSGSLAGNLLLPRSFFTYSPCQAIITFIITLGQFFLLLFWPVTVH